MDERDRVTIEEGVEVGRAGPADDPATRPLLADVYRPPARLGDPPPAGWPAVLIVHGGAWRSGDRTQLRGYGILLARAGWLAVAAEYRLSPAARWPEHLHDIKTTLRWMRAQAGTLRIDPDRVVISGNSAGGHLALMAAGTPGVADLEGEGGHAGHDTSVAACVAIYAPTALDHHEPDRGWRDLDLLTDRPSAEVARQASPVTWVSDRFPPTLLIHGTGDDVVPVGSSLAMHDALRRAGVPVDLHVYADQPHAFDRDPRYGRRIADEILFFLDRYVTGAVPPPPAGTDESAITGAVLSTP